MPLTLAEVIRVTLPLYRAADAVEREQARQRGLAWEGVFRRLRDREQLERLRDYGGCAD